MGFLENTFHPDRKRQQNWRQFSSEVGGIFTSEGASGDDEIHIPFMDHRITVDAFHLFQSLSPRSGGRYRVLGTYGLN